MGERLSLLGRGALALGSAAIALRDPSRGDMVAVLGEVTGGRALTRLRERIGRSGEGAAMVNALAPARFPAGGSEALPALRVLPARTLGREYARFMDARGFAPEARLAVRFVGDARDAWTLQRYRDVHDVWHVLTGMPTNMLGETAQKWFEAAHTGLPVAALAAAAGPARLSPRRRRVLARELVPWALRSAAAASDLLAVRYEDYLERDLDELRALWRVAPPEVSDPEALYGKRWKEHRP